MAKEIIQMYDKYHSTKKVYPKIIGECLTEDALDKIKEEVETKYEITQVVLDGSDPVGFVIKDNEEGITYNMELGGGGKQLYQHNITISFATAKQSTFFGGQVTLSILNSDSTMFTKQLLAQWLHTNYPTSYTKIKGASGSIHSYSKTAKEVVSGVTSGADTSINIHFDLSSGESPSQYYDTLEIDSINYFEDKTEII